MRPTISRGVTVLIPARDEAASIGRAIAALGSQGRGLEVVVVDDQSSDDTRGAAARAAAPGLALRVIEGRPLPDGWAGKLWALEQGLGRRRPPARAAARRRHRARTAARAGVARASARARRDARLADGRAPLRDVLGAAARAGVRVLLQAAVSVRVEQRRAEGDGGRGRRLHARPHRRVAAIGGFAAIRGALIDDCTLAAALKRHRPPIWLGMTHSVRSLRVYAVARRLLEHGSRSAFTQLRYSTAWLLARDGADDADAARSRRRRRGGARGGGAALGADGRGGVARDRARRTGPSSRSIDCRRRGR